MAEPRTEQQSQIHEGTRLEGVSADLRGGLGEAILTHTLAQPKSMFSYAMAVMGKIEGWEEE